MFRGWMAGLFAEVVSIRIDRKAYDKTRQGIVWSLGEVCFHSLPIFPWSNRFYSQATWVDSRSGIVPLYNVRKMFDKLGIEYHHEQ